MKVETNNKVWTKEHYHCYKCEKDYGDDYDAAYNCCDDANYTDQDCEGGENDN